MRLCDILQVEAIILTEVVHDTAGKLLGIDADAHLGEDLTPGPEVAIEGAVGDTSHCCQLGFTIGVFHMFCG